MSNLQSERIRRGMREAFVRQTVKELDTLTQTLTRAAKDVERVQACNTDRMNPATYDRLSELVEALEEAATALRCDSLDLEADRA